MHVEIVIPGPQSFELLFADGHASYPYAAARCCLSHREDHRTISAWRTFMNMRFQPDDACGIDGGGEYPCFRIDGGNAGSSCLAGVWRHFLCAVQGCGKPIVAFFIKTRTARCNEKDRSQREPPCGYPFINVFHGKISYRLKNKRAPANSQHTLTELRIVYTFHCAPRNLQCASGSPCERLCVLSGLNIDYVFVHAADSARVISRPDNAWAMPVLSKD